MNTAKPFPKASDVALARRRLFHELRVLDRVTRQPLDPTAPPRDEGEESIVRVLRAWTLWLAYRQATEIEGDPKGLRRAFFETLVPKLVAPKRVVKRNGELPYLLTLASIPLDSARLRPQDILLHVGGMSLLSTAVHVAIYFGIQARNRTGVDEAVIVECKARLDASRLEPFDADELEAMVTDFSSILKEIGPPPNERMEDARTLRGAAARVRLREPEPRRRGRRRVRPS